MTNGIDSIEFETHRQTCTGNVVMNERTDRFRIGDASISLPVAGVFEVDAGRAHRALARLLRPAVVHRPDGGASPSAQQ